MGKSFKKKKHFLDQDEGSKKKRKKVIESADYEAWQGVRKETPPPSRAMLPRKHKTKKRKWKLEDEL